MLCKFIKGLCLFSDPATRKPDEDGWNIKASLFYHSVIVTSLSFHSLAFSLSDSCVLVYMLLLKPHFLAAHQDHFCLSPASTAVLSHLAACRSDSCRSLPQMPWPTLHTRTRVHERVSARLLLALSGTASHPPTQIYLCCFLTSQLSHHPCFCLLFHCLVITSSSHLIQIGLNEEIPLFVSSFLMNFTQHHSRNKKEKLVI